MLAEGEDPLPEGSKKHTLTTLPNQEAESPPVQTSDQNLSGSSEAENPKQLTYLENLPMASLILLCCEDALYFYSLKSIIQVLYSVILFNFNSNYYFLPQLMRNSLTLGGE